MEQRGLTRTVDTFGRVIIPAEWRREYGLEPGVKAEIIPMGEGVLVRRKVDKPAQRKG